MPIFIRCILLFWVFTAVLLILVKLIDAGADDFEEKDIALVMKFANVVAWCLVLSVSLIFPFCVWVLFLH